MNDKPAATLKDIADAAGMSVASVSKVLNNRSGVSEESRQKVLSLAEQLGYLGRNARAMHRAGVGSVALIVPARYSSDSQFYEDIISTVLEESAANSLNVEVRLLADASRIEEMDDLLADGSPGAVIGVGLDNAEVIARLAAENVPAVLINGMDRSMQIDSVLPDNWSAGWLATRHLIEAGHRNILHMTLPHRLTMQRRMEGFRVAMIEAGQAFEESRHILDLGREGFAETDGVAAIAAAFEAGRLDDVTAIFCSTDMVAFGAMQGLQSLGFSVPQDFSIIGLDDVVVARNSRPPLTTMRIDRRELGAIGVSLLRQRIAEPGRSVTRLNVGVKLIERSTVAPPRTGPAR